MRKPSVPLLGFLCLSAGSARAQPRVYTFEATGLEWQAAAGNNQFMRQSFARAYCEGLSQIRPGASSDAPPNGWGSSWRLPTRDELLALYRVTLPFRGTPRYPDMTARSFWSSTEDETKPLHAWTVSFADGVARSLWRELDKDRSRAHSNRFQEGVDLDASPRARSLRLD